MSAYVSQSGASSTAHSVADLDGFSFPPNDYYSGVNNYLSPEDDEFGFDPPSKAAYPKMEASFTPTNQKDEAMLAGWPGFDRQEEDKHRLQMKMGLHSAALSTESIPATATAHSRYGQVTPPRSHSASSVGANETSKLSPKTTTSPRKKKAKQESYVSPPTETKPTRKRKAYRKSSEAVSEAANGSDDDKRKMSLEKNRLAAAKCRVNKKEKTEQLQRDSHDKAVQNAFLKETVSRMKEELQHMNALLITHSTSDDCKKPEQLHKHLNQVGRDYFSHHHSEQRQNYSTYDALTRQMQHTEMQRHAHDQTMPDSYFPLTSTPNHNPALLSNPPLPEFNQPGDFDVRTPQIGD